MKKFLLFSLLLVFISYVSFSQSTVFSDNFENGTTSWTLTGTWGTSTAHYHSSNNALTESPTGNYGSTVTSYATMTSGANLTSALSSELKFWAIYSIEAGFDYMYLDASADGGTTWNNLAIYDDTSSVWTQYTYSLGGYVGNSNVKIRFRFISDGAVEFDGMYIDDFMITADTVDNAPPLILHTPPVFHQGTLGAYTANSSIIDISGITVAEIIYRVDGGAFDTINGVNTSGNAFQFIIPQQQPGASVDYYIHAVDSSTLANTSSTDTFNYISGTYVSFDNGNVDFVDSISPSTGAAERITLQGPTQLVTMLIRNYTDVNRPNDSMLVHVWSNSYGLPGTDLITPFKVFPSATLQNTSPMTVIDLRQYSTQLSNLTGDVFIGYTVPVGGCWTTITQPGTYNRSYKYSGSAWTAATGTGGSSDFHFRAVTGGIIGAPVADFVFDTTNIPLVAFTDSSSDNPTSWLWNFNDGSPASILQNPTHTFTYNGNFNVCLKVTNAIGSDSICKMVAINSYLPPVANFSFDTTSDPSVSFTDISTNTPTSWLWDFDDGGITSTLQNPSHTFPAVGGTYNVCLTASSANGSSSPFCQNVVLSVGAGIENISGGKSINIYPNPLTNKSFIELNNFNLENVLFNLYNIRGELIDVDYSVMENGIQISKGQLSNGVYVFKIIVNDKIFYSGNLVVQ